MTAGATDPPEKLAVKEKLTVSCCGVRGIQVTGTHSD